MKQSASESFSGRVFLIFGFEYLASNPIIDIGKTAEALDVSYNTLSAAVKRLMDADILVQTENANRNRTFAYRDYPDILRK